MKRREYLASVGIAASLAGCPGGGQKEPDETSQTEEPTGTETKDTNENNSDRTDGDTTEDNSDEPDKSGGDGGLWLQAKYETPERHLSYNTLDYWFPENTDLETVLESTPELKIKDNISLAHGNYRPDANVGEEIEIDGSTCYMAADEYAEEMAREVLSGNRNSIISSDEVYNKKPRAVLETFWREESKIDIHEEDGESIRTFPSREEESNFYGENVVMTQMEIDEGGKITSADYHSTYEESGPLGAYVADPGHQGL